MAGMATIFWNVGQNDSPVARSKLCSKSRTAKLLWPVVPYRTGTVKKLRHTTLMPFRWRRSCR